MDLKRLNSALDAIVEKKIELEQLDYSNEAYDQVEEELHDMEDELVAEFGEYLEDALHEVHDEFCPDNDVLLPTAYLAKKYVKRPDGSYAVPQNEGVIVDVDDYPGKISRLVFIPNPLRLILIVENEENFEVWMPKS